MQVNQTLIKLLAGELTALSGTVQLAKGVQLGLFCSTSADTLRADESASLAHAETRTGANGATGTGLSWELCFHGDKVNKR